MSRLIDNNSTSQMSGRFRANKAGKHILEIDGIETREIMQFDYYISRRVRNWPLMLARK
jgi:hypothetical protein